MQLHAVVSEMAGPNWLAAPLPPLEPGPYTVRWRVLTVDGHLSRGSFSFESRSAAEPVVSPLL